MYPYIVRQLDKALLKHAIEIYLKNIRQISEEDWKLIILMHPMIDALTAHLEPVFTTVKKLTQDTELNRSSLEATLLILHDQFEKDKILRQKLADLAMKYSNKAQTVKHKIIDPTTEKQLLRDTIWQFDHTSSVHKDLKLNMSFQFWIDLFIQIENRGNVLDEIESKFIAYLKYLVELNFPKTKQMYLDYLKDPSQTKDVINALIKNNGAYQFLWSYIIAKEKYLLAGKKQNLMSLILSEQINMLHEPIVERRTESTYKDAKRGTQYCDTTIQSAELKSGISEIVRILTENHISNNLIYYIINFLNQNGISQAPDYLFKIEADLYGYMFSGTLSQFRVEVLEQPNKIRILLPICYTSYRAHETGMAETKEKPIYSELTSLIIEDKNPSSSTFSPSDISISVEECFYEILDQDLIKKWSEKLNEIIIKKLLEEIPLEKYERQLIEPYITLTQQLKNIEEAPPACLVMIMLKNYRHAITIMNNTSLRNKILASPYHTYIDKIYEKYLLTPDFKGNVFWLMYSHAKPMLLHIIAFTKQLTDESLTTETKQKLLDEIYTTIGFIKKSFDNNTLYPILRILNTEDMLVLLKYIEITNLLNTEQIVELININKAIALTLLRPQSSNALLLKNHPSAQFTQQHLVEIITTNPQLWSTQSSGFDKKQPIPTAEQMKNKLFIDNKMYRYELTGDSLVLCVYNNNIPARIAAIDAIANDGILLQRLLSSKKLKEDLPNLLRLYLDSPAIIRSQIMTFVEFNEYLVNIDDVELKNKYIIDVVKTLPIDTFITILFKELNSAEPNLKSIELYRDIIKLHLTDEKQRMAVLNRLESSWLDSIHSPNMQSVQNFINRYFFNEISNMAQVRTILNSDSKILLKLLLQVVPTNNIDAYHYLLHILKSNIKIFNDLQIYSQLHLFHINPIHMLLTNLFDNNSIVNYIPKLNDDFLIDLYRLLIELDDQFDKMLEHIAKHKLPQYKNQLLADNQVLLLITAKLSKWVFNRFENKYQQQKLSLTKNEYTLLAYLYQHDTSFKELLKSQAVLLQKMIENIDLPDLIKLMEHDKHLTKNIILAITSNAEIRNRLLGNSNPRIYSENDLIKFMTVLFNTVLQNSGIMECENLIQLFIIYQNGPQITVDSVIRTQPAISSQLHVPIEKLTDKKYMTEAKLFLSFTAAEQAEYLKNRKQTLEMIKSANHEELILLFNTNNFLSDIFLSMILEKDHLVAKQICHAFLIQIKSLSDLSNIYLYTTPEIKQLILNDNLLLNRMLSYNTNLLDLYMYDNHLRKHIENDEHLIRDMLTPAIRPDHLYNLYMITNTHIRTIMLANTVIVNKLLLMSSDKKLLKMLDIAPELSTTILLKLLHYYQDTEYMQFLINKNEQLLHRILNNINSDQLLALLTNNPKDLLIKAIINNVHCAELFIHFNTDRLLSIPNHQLMLFQMLKNNLQLKPPISVLQMIQEHAMQSEATHKTTAANVSQLADKDKAASSPATPPSPQPPKV